MQAMNATASDNNKDLMFMTIFLGVMDMATGKVRYCNAGHNQPMVIRNGHASYLDTPPCLLLGVDADAKYEAHELTLASGDILFLYTDGLTEAENVQKELLGDERALAAAQGFMGTSAELVELMRGLTNDFMGQAEQSDDFTLLSVRFKPSSSVLTIKNEFEELAKLKPFVDSFLETNGIDPSVEPQLSLALDEALTNVVMYAYPKGQTGEAEIAFEVEGDNLKVTVSDHGQPFNPLNFEVDFSIPLEERHKGGMGIHIIKEAMDAVDYEYCDNTNILKLTKKIIKTK
jgi:sigma-B regulation protein RsbU (phosphoserine phosphatase)